MTQPTTGGCFCGAIRYEIEGPPQLQLLCYCKDCRATTGAVAYPGFMVKDEQFRVARGSSSTHTRRSKAGRNVVRHFCGQCGTNLWGQTEFGLVSVAAGTLDDVEAFEPTNKVFVADAPHWAPVPEALDEM